MHIVQDTSMPFFKFFFFFFFSNAESKNLYNAEFNNTKHTETCTVTMLNVAFLCTGFSKNNGYYHRLYVVTVKGTTHTHFHLLVTNLLKTNVAHTKQKQNPLWKVFFSITQISPVSTNCQKLKQIPNYDAVCKTGIISFVSTSYSNVVSGCSAHIAPSLHQISSWSGEKCGRKWSQEVLLCADLVTPRQGKGQWKQYKLLEVKCLKYGRYEQKLVEQFACNVQR